MAEIRSVVDVEVNDASFLRYKGLFDRYTEALQKQPEMWKKIGGIHQEHAKNFETIGKRLALAEAAHKRMGEESQKQATHLRLSERLWTSMSKTTKDVASNVWEATKGLLKWSLILEGVSGLLGAGGLWGINRMAQSVASTRREARGLGLSTGEYNAFGVNFKPLINTDAFLNWVNAMELDKTKQGPARSLLGRNLSGNTEQDTIALLSATRAFAKRHRLDVTGTQFAAWGLDDAIDTDSQRRLRASTDTEFNRDLARNKGDITALGLPASTSDAWTRFTQQMQRAGIILENTFATGLVKLAGPIEHLSQAFTHLLGKVMGSQWAKEGVDKLATGIDHFADWLNGPDLDNAFNKFTGSLGDLSDYIDGIAHPFETAAEKFSRTRVGGALLGTAESVIKAASTARSGPDALYGLDLGVQGVRAGLPKGFLEGLWNKTSGGGYKNPSEHPLGGNGPFGLQWGSGFNPTDPRASEKYVLDLAAKYKGDMVAMLAAMNSPKFDAIYQQHPGDYWRYLSPQAQANVRAHVPQGFHIEIHDATGGSVHTTVAALAPGTQ
jgi:hypothetical protein